MNVLLVDEGAGLPGDVDRWILVGDAGSFLDPANVSCPYRQTVRQGGRDEVRAALPVPTASCRSPRRPARASERGPAVLHRGRL